MAIRPVDNLIYPSDVTRHFGVDARAVGSGTTVSVTSDSLQRPPTIRLLIFFKILKVWSKKKFEMNRKRFDLPRTWAAHRNLRDMRRAHLDRIRRRTCYSSDDKEAGRGYVYGILPSRLEAAELVEGCRLLIVHNRKKIRGRKRSFKMEKKTNGICVRSRRAVPIRRRCKVFRRGCRPWAEADRPAGCNRWSGPAPPFAGWRCRWRIPYRCKPDGWICAKWRGLVREATASSNLGVELPV